MVTFGERLAHDIKAMVDLRRQRGASVSWADVLPEVSKISDRLLNAGPREMAHCPLCSQPPYDPRQPAFWLAHRSTLKANDSRWILVGCRHATAINFTPIMTDEDLDQFERAWLNEVQVLFRKHTEGWTDEARNVRAAVLNLTIEPSEKQPVEA